MWTGFPAKAFSQLAICFSVSSECSWSGRQNRITLTALVDVSGSFPPARGGRSGAPLWTPLPLLDGSPRAEVIYFLAAAGSDLFTYVLASWQVLAHIPP